MNTRRQFLITAPIAVLVAATACRKETPSANSQSTTSTAGAPPTFGTGAGAGPPVTPETFAEAEKLMQVTMTPAERQQAADTWRTSLAQYLERRTGPRKVAIAATNSPAALWNPMLPGIAVLPSRDQFVRSKPDGAPLPSADDEIAFAPVTQLSRWIESKKLTSERLTSIYLNRIERLDPNDASRAPGPTVLPDDIKQKLDWNKDVFGDFFVCPLSQKQPGRMQTICLDSGKHLNVREHKMVNR